MPHPSFSEIAHRPWPVPSSKWLWRQTWYDLLFAHWPVSHEALRKHLPPGVEPQTFDGSAWLGIIPFRMSGIALRGWPDLPWFSAFAELNVRTYVEVEGRPGVWFLSLDAPNWLAIWGARKFFHLPYHRADIQVQQQDGAIEYECQRRNAPERFRGSYRASAPPIEPRPETLEFFLTERYCLYCQNSSGVVFRADVHHRPWPLQTADATIEMNTMTEALEIPLQGQPLLHYSAGVDAVVWPPRKISH